METVLLKLSGEILSGTDQHRLDATLARSLVKQIKTLQTTHYFTIVIGGGNFFRGSRDGKRLNINQPTADTIGMLATVMNGLMLHDFFEQEGVSSTVLSTYDVPGVHGIDPEHIAQAQKNHSIIIFTGGTGNPFFSTDTAAVVRALQVGAKIIWKASTVDGIYDADPATHKAANLIKKITYDDVITRKLHIMDLTSIIMAQEHTIAIRVFKSADHNALIQAARDPNFGSIIQ